MKNIYKGDSRYEKIKEQMDLLGITDVSTDRQVRNGTIIWRLPFKSRGNHVEFGSFSTGYVRNQGNQCHSNWQINTRRPSEEYYPKYEWVDGEQIKTDLYRKYISYTCNLIPIEIDRLEYMMKYIIKNEFIKQAKIGYNTPYNSVEVTRHWQNKAERLEDKLEEITNEINEIWKKVN